MSIEEVSLAVPEGQRPQFLAHARRVAERARERSASSTELQLALGVLRVLYGGVPSASPSVHG